METELAEFRRRARDWLSEHAPAPVPLSEDMDVDVSVFHDLEHEEELALIRRAMDWQQRKFDAGYGAIAWPCEHGGAGLPPEFAEAFAAEEAHFTTPRPHELFSVTLHLIAPTLRVVGPPGQWEELIRQYLRGERLCVQLFSEPGAGSDLASLATRAVRDGDSWVLNGQKVWNSGAQFADWGLLIARTDPDVPKHRGMTAFLIAMDAPGVTVRPLRQMSGGTSFAEVFLDDVRVPDTQRLGEVGRGWKVALTTLGFEREVSGTDSRVGGGTRELLPLARKLNKLDDPHIRRLLADVHISERVAEIAGLRDRARLRSGHEPGAEGSLRKLHWVQGMALATRAAEAVLGPRLAADTEEPGTFAWTEHLLGAPGYRIAGGADEIQRNIIAERLLGLPAEPRTDRDLPWRDVPR
jgi:alkylation response protein AidB-like acyl-CoA dehydrogenase